MTATIHHGDCLEILRGMADASVDAVVTDPPYGLSFMGKKWDYDVPSADIWRECLRVLKPGGHLLAFAGTRTQHRMAVNIEDAGFEVRDLIAWVYGSGFPKSHDVSKAIDKAAGAQREFVGPNKFAALNGKANVNTYGAATRPDETAPATDAAKQWRGWGTALKPALEPITLARKPLAGTVADNVLAHGTGGINVDGCRVEIPESDKKNYDANMACHERYADGRKKIGGYEGGWNADSRAINNTGARWPANLIHDGSDEACAAFPLGKSPQPKATKRSGAKVLGGNKQFGGGFRGQQNVVIGYGDTGSAARFFYCAKASKADRDEGCEGFEERKAAAMNQRCVNCGHGKMDGRRVGPCCDNPQYEAAPPRPGNRNHHPTVKPTALMRYLCRLVTPPRGIVLDPFMGSGSTGKAAALEGFQFIGIEREAEYVKIAKARIAKAEAERGEMLPLEEVAA